METITYKCENCGEKRKSWHKFCSKECYHKKGHSQEAKLKMRKAKLENPSKYWLGKKMPESVRNSISLSKIGKQKGVKNIMWKGDKVGYRALHLWVERCLGKPIRCEHCGIISKNRAIIHWANKSHNYLRDLNDWLPLCVKCHFKYDKR